MFDFYELTKKNKESGERYNKYAYPTLLDFLDLYYQYELDCSEVKHSNVIMDRCIYDEYFIFAKTAISLGDLKRPYLGERV